MENIKNKLETKLLNALPAEYAGSKVVFSQVEKNNRTLNGYTISCPQKKIVPTLYVEAIMEEIKYGDYNEDEAIERGVQKYLNALAKTPDIDMENLLNRENILKTVIPMLVNKERNAHRLENLVYRDWHDLSILYIIKIEMPDGFATTSITDAILKMAGLSEEELHEAAIKNISGEEMIDDILSIISGALEDEEREEIPGYVPMLVCSTKDKHYGSSQIILPEVQEKISKKIGGNFYVLPSSVHEIICVPEEDADVEKFKSMVYEVNRTQVEPEDFLSDNIYYYNGESLTLVV